MDDEIERRKVASKASLSGSVPPSNDVSIKKTTKDLHGLSPSSLSFDESVSTVPSYEEWSSHHSITERHDLDDDDDDEDDEDYFGDGEDEDDYDQHLQSNHRHPRTPTKIKENFCYASLSPTTASSSSTSSPSEKKSKLKKRRNGSTTTNSKPKLKLRLKSKLISGLISPKKKGRFNINKEGKEDDTAGMTDWQKELGLPAGTTEEEAIAVLLTRELSELEL